MLKRTISINSNCYLAYSQGQLKINIKETSEVHSIPIEDIGYLILDNKHITLSSYLVQQLAQNNVAMIFSNDKHMPQGMILPLTGHQLQQEIFSNQIQASVPLKKQLWLQTIKAKITNQATVLELFNHECKYLIEKALKVKSGDNTNEEAKAARYYWKQLFNHSFTRSRDGNHPNNFLNYGYAILRATVARALTGSGLLPTLGIHHHNRYNAYCLADDIMEPYRPFVDLIVIGLYNEHSDQTELTTIIKQKLLQIPVANTIIRGHKSPLMTAVSETTASLSKCFRGESKTIIYPEICT
jgi:CRISPR-associated protein Cas1